MQLHEDLEIGAASHTGRVRSTNEDDFLILAPLEVEAVRERGRLLAIADGMGGAAGGAEASRTAVRSLATAFLSAPAGCSPEERLRQSFAAASRDVHALSQEVPALREMGTTLTAVNLVDGSLVLGHVGDTRCYLLRDGQLRQLTDDHAVRETESYLTRCVGGGQDDDDPDVAELALLPGDVVALMSDGLWSVVDEARLARTLAGHPPQEAADALLQAAYAGGGPDNCTVVVVRVRRADGELGELREVQLPREERRIRQRLPVPAESLAAARWPWWTLALAVGLLAVGIIKLASGADSIAALIGSLRPGPG